MNPCVSRRESVALLASGQCPERAAVELTGKDGGPVEIDDTSAAARVAALMAAAQARKEAQAERDDVDDLV